MLHERILENNLLQTEYKLISLFLNQGKSWEVCLETCKFMKVFPETSTWVKIQKKKKISFIKFYETLQIPIFSSFSSNVYLALPHFSQTKPLVVTLKNASSLSTWTRDRCSNFVILEHPYGSNFLTGRYLN